jgi:hypothetical protein
MMNRRTFLKGFGASIALPLLDGVAPRFGPNTPRRLVFCYVPNGIDMRYWTPRETGAGFEFPRILKPLEPYREHVLVFSGLTQNGGRALGDGPGDHARAAACFLTGVHPRKTAGADIQNGISIDQVAAQSIGKKTRFASLELGCEDGRQVGNCDSGYSCAYSNNISWRSETTPNPPEINPRAVFERLFGSAEGEDPAARAKRERYEKSILDFVQEDTRKLQTSLGPTDRRKLDEYLTAVREIERRIEAAEKQNGELTATLARPEGIPVEYAEHARLMFDLMTVALQTDQTRIVTFMMAREGSTRTYREIGISDPHHPLTHHRRNEEMMEKVARINCHHLEQFAWFIGKLQATPDGDGTLLDHSAVVYGSGIADGNRHTHHDLPVLVVGKALDNFRQGRHLRYPVETPMANLYLTLLDRAGVNIEKLGDSNGKLEPLSDADG